MKQSFRTAKDIYNELSTLQTELNEIGEACSAIRDDFGEDHKGYTLLNRQYDEKLNELRKAEKIRFVQEIQSTGIDISQFGELPKPLPPSSDPEQYYHK